ncbi:alpha/beta fold hydrolase [Leifsonia sp. fls2-241-R2A-40a]|uniref:alpha/beta fold hydrolase n=1 Tax=Leifsonia sp. fls2-241-R2A-40a TaxID=3040290 RepID=UPI0025505B46|nr:alpha/beta fold hydrolase [Leifsonia sp. fls2-241-R2A-40a]
MKASTLGHLEEGSGPPLVLLMGLGARAEAWRPHLDAWSRTFRCIAVDNPGAGESDLGDAPLTVAGIAARVADLLDELGVQQVAVAGISMGACTAQELALQRPDLVARLVLVAPWAASDPYTDGVLESLTASRTDSSARHFNLLLRNTVWTPEWINDHAHEFEAQLGAEPPIGVDAFAAQARACAGHDTRDRLSAIGVPTLVTVGADDVFIRPARSYEVADGVPGARLQMFGGTGHVHHWERLDEFNTIVEEWLT